MAAGSVGPQPTDAAPPIEDQTDARAALLGHPVEDRLFGDPQDPRQGERRDGIGRKVTLRQPGDGRPLLLLSRRRGLRAALRRGHRGGRRAALQTLNRSSQPAQISLQNSDASGQGGISRRRRGRCCCRRGDQPIPNAEACCSGLLPPVRGNRFRHLQVELLQRRHSYRAGSRRVPAAVDRRFGSPTVPVRIRGTDRAAARTRAGGAGCTGGGGGGRGAAVAGGTARAITRAIRATISTAAASRARARPHSSSSTGSGPAARVGSFMVRGIPAGGAQARPAGRAMEAARRTGPQAEATGEARHRQAHQP